MFAAEQILNSLTYEEIYYTLRSIVDEDCYLNDYLNNQLVEEFLYLLEMYDIIMIASDDRILLTRKGESLLQFVSSSVELEKKSTKVKKNKKL